MCRGGVTGVADGLRTSHRRCNKAQSNNKPDEDRCRDAVHRSLAVRSSDPRVRYIPSLGLGACQVGQPSPNCGFLTRGESISEPGDLTPLRSRPVCSRVLATRCARPLKRRPFPCASTLDGSGRIVIPTPPTRSRSGSPYPANPSPATIRLRHRALHRPRESAAPQTPATPRAPHAARRAHPSNPPYREKHRSVRISVKPAPTAPARAGTITQGRRLGALPGDRCPQRCPQFGAPPRRRPRPRATGAPSPRAPARPGGPRAALRRAPGPGWPIRSSRTA
jgi:hypothetical protein